MAEKKSYLSLIRWLARVWSLFSIAFLMLFFIGEGIAEGVGPLLSIPLRDWLGLLFFPVGVGSGLILAWRREALGGLITLCSLFAFYLTLWAFDGRFPGGPYFILVAAPGFFFLLHWLLSRRASLPPQEIV